VPDVTTRKSTRKILTLLRDERTPRRREIAEMLGDITENSVKYLPGKLKAEGRIRRIGPAKGGHWEIIGGEYE